MKRIGLVTLSIALATAAMALAVDDVSAASRNGVHGKRVHATSASRRAVAADRGYDDQAGRSFEGGTFAGGVYLPAGAYRGLYASDSATPRGSSSYDYYPTRSIVQHSYVPVDSYYGPLCNPRVDSPCQ